MQIHVSNCSSQIGVAVELQVKGGNELQGFVAETQQFFTALL